MGYLERIRKALRDRENEEEIHKNFPLMGNFTRGRVNPILLWIGNAIIHMHIVIDRAVNFTVVFLVLVMAEIIIWDSLQFPDKAIVGEAWPIRKEEEKQASKKKRRED